MPNMTDVDRDALVIGLIDRVNGLNFNRKHLINVSTSSFLKHPG